MKKLLLSATMAVGSTLIPNATQAHEIAEKTHEQVEDILSSGYACNAGTWILLHPSDPRYDRIAHIFETCVNPILVYAVQDDILAVLDSEKLSYHLLMEPSLDENKLDGTIYLGDSYDEAIKQADQYREESVLSNVD